MRRVFVATFAVVVTSAAACSFLLDFDELQQVPPDAGSGATAGTGGSAGSGGMAGSAGAAGSGGGAPSLMLDELAPALAQAICANLDACYKSAGELIIKDEDCVALFTAALDQQNVEAIRTSVDAGTITYDPVAGAACIAELTAGSQADPPECADLNAIIEGCKSAFGSLAAVDEPCNHRFECGVGLQCRLEGCPGTCRRFLQPGEECLESPDCDPLQGLYCRKVTDPDAGTVAMTGTCETFVSTGTACVQGTDECEPGAICLGDTCRRVSNIFTLPAGEECYTNDFLCDPGLSCEFSGLPFNKLQPATCVEEKQPPAACKLALPGECAPGSYCSANIFNTDGVCLALPVENQACAAGVEQGLALSAQCASGLACVNGLCKPMRNLNEPCEADNQCYSAACLDSVCVPPACPPQ